MFFKYTYGIENLLGLFMPCKCLPGRHGLVADANDDLRCENPEKENETMILNNIYMDY